MTRSVSFRRAGWFSGSGLRSVVTARPGSSSPTTCARPKMLLPYWPRQSARAAASFVPLRVPSGAAQPVRSPIQRVMCGRLPRIQAGRSTTTARFQSRRSRAGAVLALGANASRGRSWPVGSPDLKKAGAGDRPCGQALVRSGITIGLVESIPVDLTGVPETLLGNLGRRAAAARIGALRDPVAVEIVERLDYDFADSSRGVRLHAARVGTFDAAVRGFLSLHPAGTVVALGEGLETQFWRLDNGRVRWLTVDLP